MKFLGGLACLLLVGMGVGQQPGSESVSPEQQLEQLRAQVQRLEAEVREQRRVQGEINGEMVGAMERITDKLDLFLEAVRGGAVQPVGSQVDPGEESWSALWVSAGALLLAFVALLWDRRSVVPVAVDGRGEELGGSEEVKRQVEWELSEGMEGESGGDGGQPVGDLSVEHVGRGELGLANVSPVELEEPEEDSVAGRALRPPSEVEWKLACANPEVGEGLVVDLLRTEPRVLKAPAPRVEEEDGALRIAYSVHPDLVVADRTQIASRLIEVLRSVPPPNAAGLPVG